MKWTLALLAMISLAHADDFTTIDGVKHSGSVSRVEPDGIVIETDAGIEKLRFDALPKPVQERFKYDPSRARAFISSAQASQQQLANKREADRQAAQAKVEAVVAAMTPRPKPTPETYSHALNQPARTDGKVSKGDRVVVCGLVVQRTSKGLLIKCSGGSGARKAEGLIWLTGIDAREDASVNGYSILVGTYEYTTIEGAERMADHYEWDDGVPR